MGVGQAGRYVVTETGDTVFVNLYPAASIALPERSARLEMTGDFPRMKKIRVRVIAAEPSSFTLSFRIPPWADGVKAFCDGVSLKAPKSGRRLKITRVWKAETDVDIELVSGSRLVFWPVAKPLGVGVFDGPLCLGLSAETADLGLSWAVEVDDAGQPRLDARGRPQAVDPSGKIRLALEPVSSGWLVPDVKNPIPRRILFQTKRSQ